MKPSARRGALAAVGLVAGLMLASNAEAAADDWQLRVFESSRNCIIITKGSDTLGTSLISSHASRKPACEAGRRLFDGTLQDQGKCWTYGTATVSGCAKDGVNLPK